MRFRFENYQQFQALRFAVEEINRSPDLLPNRTLGFYVYDSCAALQSELEGTLWMLTGQSPAILNYCCRESPPLAAIIGHSLSTYSILMAHILGQYRFPQVSYFSTSSLLSDRKQFSSFFRTVPSDIFQSKGIAQLVKHFKWTWVGLIAADDDYGHEGIEVLRQEIIKEGICVAYTEYISSNFIFKNIWNIANVIKESSAKVVVAFSTDIYLIPVLDEMLKLNLLYYIKNVRVNLSNGREVSFDKDGNPPAVYDIVNWQPGADGTIKQVKVGSYDSRNSSGDVFGIKTTTISWGTKNKEIPLSVCSQSCPEGFRKATRQGEPVCCFECVPCGQGEISNQTNSIECWKCPWDMWPNSARDRCLSKPIEFLSYEEPLAIILASTGVISSLIPISIFRLFIRYKSTPIVRANNYSVSCILLVSLSFCFLCALAFIGYPQPEKCLLRQAAFGLVFTLCVSCILAKTVIVVFAFMATKPGSRLKKWTTPRVPYMIITICTFIQLTLCIFWLSISPPFPQYNIEAKPGIIVVECNENSQFAFWCMLGYLGFLASVSFTVAFLARRLPDSYNEAKFITFSMLAFLSVWVSFIPASLSAQGKYTVAMEIFAILTSTWALVFCMFLPKCFVILFRPNMNTKEKLMGKDRSRM
ncbi:extracellular calcium-sensing receptor-like [Xenopus tropicalis]|uniref:Extracellular calcium-sensing receptor-like n=1 Tax=Xenopus tropicalis TaxID=8364 RepID=A0A8J1JAU0_XENTR|nr:extracellular calcium-sensing receptor-like [Xenopus tropicalis]